VKLRPITVMVGVAAVIAVVAVTMSWRSSDRSGHQPAALPLALDQAAAGASVSTLMARPDVASLDHITYVRGPAVAEIDGSASAWVLAPAAPDRGALTRLAAALDVPGSIREESGVLLLGDRRGRVLEASMPSGPAWYFSDAAAQGGVVSCAQTNGVMPSAGQSSTAPTSTPPELQPPTQVCPEPTPPAGVPDGPTAEGTARRILERAGLEVTGANVSVDARAWATTIRFTPTLDERTPVEGLDTVIVFGGGGAVQAANGWFGRPTRGDRYPLVGIDAAIARLQRGEGQIGPQPMLATGAPVTTVPSPEPGTSASSDSGGSTVTPTLAPAPVDQIPHLTIPGPTTPQPTIPQPREVTVTITKATLVLVAVPGTDGSTYVVPAYRLESADQRSWTVLAIDDSFITTPVPKVTANDAPVVPASPESTGP
jgi:hypothetical protein